MRVSWKYVFEHSYALLSPRICAARHMEIDFSSSFSPSPEYGGLVETTLKMCANDLGHKIRIGGLTDPELRSLVLEIGKLYHRLIPCFPRQGNFHFVCVLVTNGCVQVRSLHPYWSRLKPALQQIL